MLNSLILFGQDREPSPWLFKWGDSDQGRIFEPDSFKQTSVFTGFQWSNTLPMDNALLNNCVAEHGINKVETGSRVNPLYSINQPTWCDSGYYFIGAFYSPFMQYEPTLFLTDTTTGKILRPADHSDPIFGFKHIDGEILSDSTNENYSRLILYKDDLENYGSDSIVLKNIWPQPCFNTKGFWEFKREGQTDNYLGKKWYLTINLKRLNPAVDNVCDNNVVLSVQIPYTLWNGTTGLIQFDSIPINNKDSVELLNYYENRGYAQLIKPVISEPDTIINITRNMLPIRTDTSSISISASFLTNGDPDLFNPQFSDESSTFKIKNIDIIVKYLGKLDIAIQNILIESINAHILLRGEVDSLGTISGAAWKDARGFKPYLTDDILFTLVPDEDDPDKYDTLWHKEYINSVKDIIQITIDSMKAKSNNWQDAKLFRFYYQDVESNKFYWWGPLRYCNKLTNGMFITRDEQTYPKLYEYYTKCQNRWVGFLYSKDDYHMPTPYAKNGNESWESMNLKYGYIGAYGGTHFPDTLNSDYETHLPFEKDSLWFVCRDSYYLDSLLYQGKTVQPRWERSLYESYYKPDTKLSEMLYSDKPWWLYHLLYNVQNENEHIVFKYYRPKTGEEIRMLLNSSLIRGCKGFIYDGDENYHFPNCHMGNMGIGDGTRICDTSDVFSNWVGADYIDSINNTWNAFNYAKLDTLAKRMGISRNKVYIGTRSIRTELFNFHSKIRRADEELMKLRLVASYSKGFRVQQNHHPDYPDDSTFRIFLAWDNVRNRIDTTRFKIRPYGRTRKIYQPDGEPIYLPLYEPWDSTFIDFTLLKDKDTSINDLAYIGIQNRRTDPLVPWFLKKDWYHTSDTDSVYIPFYDIKFYSTSEFEDSCNIAKNPNTYQKFRDNWFKRLGCRSVTLPFNYTNPNNPDEYALLRITELGSDEVFDSTWSYGRKMAYWNKIDTVIGQDRQITFNMLPGEGKIFKVQVLHQEKNNISYQFDIFIFI